MLLAQLQEILTKREYQIITSFRKGLSPERIAEELNISRNAVDQARYRIKKKLGDELFSKILAPVSSPGEKCVQNSLDLEEILSPTELRIFLSLKRSQKSWDLVAEEARTTPECARDLTKRIKKKLGDQYDELVKHNTPIEGVVVFQEPREKDEPANCQNCKHFYCSINSKEGKKIFCSKQEEAVFKNKRERCSLYQEYIRVDENSDLARMNEALEDKNFLRMAYRAGTGYEPTDGIERSQYAIAGLGFTGYHFRRRRQARAIMEAASRHIVVVLTSEERSRPEVKEVLDYLRLTPTKLDFEEEYTIARYVIKSYGAYQQLMSVLKGDVDFIIEEEGTLKIFFEYESKINHIDIIDKATKKKKVLNLDQPNRTSKEHTAEFRQNPGKYIIEMRLGSGVLYKYEITVDKREGKTRITEVKMI